MLPATVALVVAALGLALAPPLAGDAAPARPSGTLLFLSDGNRLTSFDVASGRKVARRIRGVPNCAPDLQLSGDSVVFAGVRRRRTVVFSIPLTLDRPPRRLGAAHAFAASATPGRVWLAGTDCDQPRMVGVKEVTVDGRVIASRHRRVPSGWLAGAVDRGLVVTHRRALIVWNPRTGRTVGRLRLDALVDVKADKLAGCAPHSRCERLAIVDSASGRATVARPPGRLRLAAGARLSPDGSLLAAPALANRRWRADRHRGRLHHDRPRIGNPARLPRPALVGERLAVLPHRGSRAGLPPRRDARDRPSIPAAAQLRGVLGRLSSRESGSGVRTGRAIAWTTTTSSRLSGRRRWRHAVPAAGQRRRPARRAHSR